MIVLVRLSKALRGLGLNATRDRADSGERSQSRHDGPRYKSAGAAADPFWWLPPSYRGSRHSWAASIAFFRFIELIFGFGIIIITEQQSLQFAKILVFAALHLL